MDRVPGADGGGDSAPRYIGPIRLAPAVAPSQVAVFLTVVVTLSFMLSFIGVLQPYLLDQLGIAAGVQGRLSGNLAFVDQLGFLLCISSAGTLADQLGRRRTLIVALTGMLVMNFLFPFAAGVGFLFVLRCAFGATRAPHTAAGTAMMMDYPDNASRGKFLSLMLVVQGLCSALLIGVMGVRLPGWFMAAGLTSLGAIRLAFAVVALAGFAGLLFAVFGLARDEDRFRRSPVASPGRPFAAQLESLKALYRHARARSRFRFIMLMALVIRSDFAVMEAFLSLLILRDGIAAGLTRTQALTRAGLCFTILRVCSLIAPPICGVLADRHDRSRLLALMLGLTALSFLSILFVADVSRWTLYLDIGFIGFCETGTVVVAQSILGEEAPPERRGISMAFFAFLGTIGVMIASTIGGQLFDRVGHRAPFVFIGVLNLCFAIWAATLVRDHAVFSGEAS